MKKPWNGGVLKNAQTQEAKLIRKIKSAHASGDKKRARHFTKTYLNSWAAKYVAVVKAYKNMPRHYKTAGMDLGVIAKRLDVFQGTDEPVTLHLREKASGNGHRQVMDFGIENRALQYLVLRVLEARTVLSPMQFGTKRGVKAAAAEVLKNLNEGFVHTTEIDVSNCFPSVGVKALPDILPIPTKVIDHSLSGQSLNITTGNFIPWVGLDDKPSVEEYASGLYADIIKEGQQGLPQGSATSPIIVEMLFAPVFLTMPESVRLVGYMDNFLVMGKSENDVASMKINLEAFLLGHPAGPFVPRVESTSKPSQKFDLLGYEFFLSGSTYGARPSGGNLSKFCHKFDRGLDQISGKKHSHTVRKRKAKELRRYVRSWTSAFAPWKKSVAFRTQRLGDIKHAESGL